MTYAVKEMFYSLQGEGARAGRVAVFCRFSGCNLWSGEEKHRASADCQFCDTDFVGVDGAGGGKFSTAQTLADTIFSYWPPGSAGKPYVVFTGGEPLLQLDTELIEAMHTHGFEVAVESNGTLVAPTGIDWLCISPKAGCELVQTQGNELKLVFPQQGLDPQHFRDLAFEQFYLQPREELQDGKQDTPSYAASEHTRLCTDYCLDHPGWKLSLQTHKFLGIR